MLITKCECGADPTHFFVDADGEPEIVTRRRYDEKPIYAGACDRRADIERGEALRHGFRVQVRKIGPKHHATIVPMASGENCPH